MTDRLDITGYGRGSDSILRSKQSQLVSHISRVRQVVEIGDYTMPEASINAPFDEHLIQSVEQFATQLHTSALRFVFLVGIGGSNLGTEAIYNVLFHTHNLSGGTDSPRLVTLDTNNPASLAGVEELAKTISSPEEFVVITVSKSGGTTETLANTELLLAMLERQCGPVPQRVVVVSDIGSPLLMAGQASGMHTFAMPPMIGGRYSVFTAVGLVPLILLGVPVRELVAGAVAAVQGGQHQDVALNEAAQLAILASDAYEQGLSIHNLFLFASEFETLGKWWRQLVGESLGKTTVDKSAVVGVTPTVAIGSTDLHSMGQLYLGGPKQTFTIFMSAPARYQYTVPDSRVFPTLVPMIKGKSVAEIQSAILAGTKAAYQEQERLYLEWRMPAVSPYELGYFMQTMMMATIYTGCILNVNPFDQPDVEAYKLKTKELLENAGNGEG